jgi:hypothetical protein
MRVSFHIEALEGAPLQESKVAEVILNAKGVDYPKIAFSGGPSTGVPFPNIVKPLAYCPENLQGSLMCPKSDTKLLRKNTILYYATQGWSVPFGVTPEHGGGFDTHHILPSGCGGGNESGNGVFLIRSDHSEFTTWWSSVPPCAPNRGNSGRD